MQPGRCSTTARAACCSDPGRNASGGTNPFANSSGFNTYRVLVTAVRNSATANSMQFADIQFFGTVVDTTAPLVGNTFPAPGAVVRELTQVEVLFDEPVDGVDASDLLVNGLPATGITYGTPNQFIFQFPQPPTGTVTIAFAPTHGIHDQAVPPNAFAGSNWTYTLDPKRAFFDVQINEFMTDNASGIRDETQPRGLIELYNSGATAVDLSGWFLTDEAGNLSKWQFPSGAQLAANGYMLVWASAKNRTNIGPLHTNFKLDKGGEYLGLVNHRKA